jgi:hypothetical protein
MKMITTRERLRKDLRLAVIRLMMHEKYTEDRMCRLVRVYYRTGLMEQKGYGEFIQTLIEEVS